MGEQSASDADAVSAEEWNVIHALRRLGQPSVHLAADASQDDLESAYRRLESEIFEDIGTTLDRMIDRADQTSGPARQAYPQAVGDGRRAEAGCLSAGGLLSSVAKWAAIEHRLSTLESKLAGNDAKIGQLIQGLIERVVALEAERRTIDAKLAGVGFEARGAAAAASTVAASAATHALLERIIRLEIDVAALRAQPTSGNAPKLDPPNG